MTEPAAAARVAELAALGRLNANLSRLGASPLFDLDAARDFELFDLREAVQVTTGYLLRLGRTIKEL